MRRPNLGHLYHGGEHGHGATALTYASLLEFGICPSQAPHHTVHLILTFHEALAKSDTSSPLQNRHHPKCGLHHLQERD